MARKKRNQFDVDEIYRGLRTNIEFSQMDDAIQVINVVSTIPNEGKSTIACNLARIMAAKYKNVLLIDCDLRNASVHKTLQISNRSGLTNIISEFREGVSIHSFEGVQDVQYDGGYPLSVITAGHRVPNPSEVLGSKRLAKFLNQARQEFGYIIIDCPPVAVASDAIPLCNVSDGVLYVVDSKSSDKRKVKAAINDVERNGGHVMGVVLNKVESASDSNYGYGYRYGCGNSNLEITKNDILEVARDDANATKKECSNVSIQEEKKYYTVSFDTTTGSYEYKIGKDGIIQERNYKRSNSEDVSTTEPVEEKKEETKTETKKEEKKESTF
uniref:CpsD/CapB family tyrosine-protein kinase n=1 Tax=Holdemanella porci TaxID=2652276 RepID=UPI003FD88165